MFDEMYQDQAAQAFSAKLLRPVEPKAPAFSFWGMVRGAGKAVPAGVAEGIGSTADALGGFGQVMAATDARPGGMFSLNKPRNLSDVVLGSTEQDRAAQKLLTDGVNFRSEAGRSFRNVAETFMPDPLTTHASERVVADLFRFGSKALTAAATMGNVPGAIVAGAEEAFTQSDKLAEQGVDLATRTKVAAVQAPINAIGLALPVAGKTAAQTVGLALAGGPASFMAQNAATRKILQDADYGKIADTFDPLDPVGLTLSTLVPLGFGAIAMRGRSKAAAKVPDETVDAARVALLRENVDKTNPVPGDLAAADAHAKAYTKAMEQMAAGERVDVADLLPQQAAVRAVQQMDATMKKAVPFDLAKDLTPAQRALESDLTAKVLDDYEAAKAEYATRPDSMGGKVLNTDIARELSPGYLADRTQSAAVHEPSSYFIKQLYAEKLKNLQEGETVLFTSGGTGAGKTTGIRDVPAAQAMADRAAMIYDTNMNTFESAVKKIEQALAANGKVQIIHVQRDPVDALVNGALKRAMGQEKEFGTGRTVPISEHAKTHKGAAKVLPKLVEKYKDDPRVGILVIDNTRGKGNARMADVAFVKNWDYTGVEGKLNEALKQQYDSGAISESVYRGTAEDVGQGRSQVLRPDVPQQSQPQYPAGSQAVRKLADEANGLLKSGASPAEVVGRIKAEGGQVSPELQNMLVGMAEFGGRADDLLRQLDALGAQRGGGQLFDLIGQAVENMRAGKTIEPPKLDPLDQILADIEVRNPTALDAPIAIEFDIDGKPGKTVTAREFLDAVSREAAQETADAKLLQVAANCFISGGA